MVLRRGLLATIVLVLCALMAQAQLSREVFGKNRIQYRQFDWQYLSGENFDVYFYDARKGVATDALNYLESEFDRITDLIGYPPYLKTKVFIYNSLADLRQSNVGLNNNVYNVGGETDFIKPYVEVAHLGTAQEFKEELLYQISNLMLNEMMFGGNLKDMFQSSILMNLPDWFVGGASLYVSKGWDNDMDDYIRQLIRTRKAKRATKLSGRDAALVGQSIWNFIAEKYGKSSVANILNYTRVTRNEERSILITLGVTFRQLLVEWQKFYADQEKQMSLSYVSPADSTLFTRGHHNRTTEYTTVKISPDGQYVAYAENDRGNYIVKVRSLQNGREKTIIGGGSKVINQRVDYRQPLIAWSDASTLGVIAVKHGEYVFWLYDLKTKTKVPRQLEKFSNIRSMEFSSNGRLIILSGDFEGKSDLFLLSTRRDRVRRLTNDLYDDLDPSFIPNSNRIIFSSNRRTDSLRTATPQFEKLTDNYSLFIFDLDSTNLLLKRVTNTLSKDFAPKAQDENTFYYLSDQRGIVNLFRYNKSTGIYSQVSNYSSSIKDFDINFDTRTLALITEKNLKKNIFVTRDFNPSRQIFTPATRRKEIQQARVIRERRKQEDSENKTMSIKDLLNARRKQAQAEQDTTSTTDSLQHKKPVDSVAHPQPPLATADTVKKPQKEEVVNTDNYSFEDEPAVSNSSRGKQQQSAPATPAESFLTRYMKARDKSRVTGPFPYETKFSSNNLVTSLLVDPLRGLGISIQTQMNDMLENYRFFGGIMSTIDLRSGDAYAEFQYLPSLIDFSARFDRKAIRWRANANDNDDPNLYNYSLNRLEFGASLPLSERTRITIKPFAAMARTVDLGKADYPSVLPSAVPVNNYYGGFKSEIVYDNSVSTGLNLIEGTRGKISFQHYQGLNNGQLSFSQASIDIRHYQKVYKEIVFAVRGFAGTFFGNSPKTYLLGGMDNWLFNKSRTDGKTSEGQANPLGVTTANQDLLFVEFATSLRGFNYATVFGNNVIMGNAEFRVPIARALANGPISSNFLRNMQLIAFYDIGTSWSGKPPFSSGNSVSYEEITRPSFKAQVKNYLNPWLYSYGVGMRTVMLGYYMKFDLAWPVENYEVLKPKLQVTLGFDF